METKLKDTLMEMPEEPAEIDMEMKDIIKLELLVVAIVFYFVGLWIKKSETEKDKFIALIDRGLGIGI